MPELKTHEAGPTQKLLRMGSGLFFPKIEFLFGTTPSFLEFKRYQIEPDWPEAH